MNFNTKRVLVIVVVLFILFTMKGKDVKKEADVPVFFVNAFYGFDDVLGVTTYTLSGDTNISMSGTLDVFHFDGDGDYLRYENNLHIGENENATIIVAFKSDNLTTLCEHDTESCWIFSQDNFENLGFAVADGYPMFFIRGNYKESPSDKSVASYVMGAEQIIEGQWYQLVGVRDAESDTILFYVNGILVGTANDQTKGNLSVGRGNYTLAKTYESFDHDFGGEVYEAGIIKMYFNDSMVSYFYDGFLDDLDGCESNNDCGNYQYCEGSDVMVAVGMCDANTNRCYADDMFIESCTDLTTPSYCEMDMLVHDEGVCMYGECMTQFVIDDNCYSRGEVCEFGQCLVQYCDVNDDCTPSDNYCNGTAIERRLGECQQLYTCGFGDATEIVEECADSSKTCKDAECVYDTSSGGGGGGYMGIVMLIGGVMAIFMIRGKA